jgi:hypothetical protein
MFHEIVHIPSLGQYGREQLLQRCHDVRISVFHREQGYPLDTEIDKLCSSCDLSILSVSLPWTRVCLFPLLLRLDETAEHFLLRLLPSLQPIGTVRVSRASSQTVPYYKLSRLAVLNQHRGHHFGRELVLALHEWVVADSLSRGVQSTAVVCHSQIPVKAFYAK